MPSAVGILGQRKEQAEQQTAKLEVFWLRRASVGDHKDTAARANENFTHTHLYLLFTYKCIEFVCIPGFTNNYVCLDFLKPQ